MYVPSRSKWGQSPTVPICFPGPVRNLAFDSKKIYEPFFTTAHSGVFMPKYVSSFNVKNASKHILCGILTKRLFPSFLSLQNECKNLNKNPDSFEK